MHNTIIGSKPFAKVPFSFFTKTSVISKTFLLTLTPFITVIINSKMALIGLGIIMLIDLITGVKKTLHVRGITTNPFKRDFWRCLKSSGLRAAWRKAYEYGMGVFVLMAIEIFFFSGTVVELLDKNFSITELGIVIASTIEAWSIFENIEAVTGSNPLKKFGDLYKKVKQIIKK